MLGDAPIGDVPSEPDGWILSTLPRAIAFAAGLLADRDAAEDVVHDCYCRLLAKAGEYDLARDGSKLLFRSITNACIDRARKKSPVSMSAIGSDSEDTRMIDLPDSRAPEPWQAIDHAQLQRAIADGLAKLPMQQRAALELKTLGHSLTEIAVAIGVTPTNAGVLIHRARQFLAKQIEAFAEP